MSVCGTFGRSLNECDVNMNREKNKSKRNHSADTLTIPMALILPQLFVFVLRLLVSSFRPILTNLITKRALVWSFIQSLIANISEKKSKRTLFEVFVSGGSWTSTHICAAIRSRSHYSVLIGLRINENLSKWITLVTSYHDTIRHDLSPVFAY